MLRTAVRAQARAVAIAATCLVLAGGQATAEDDLCGRPRETPDALYARLTKTEKLPEAFRDKAYATINDAAKATIWSFTVAGHPAHPSVVCRNPVEDGDKLRIEMGIQCEASDEACEELARGFQSLNEKLIRDAESKARQAPGAAR